MGALAETCKMASLLKFKVVVQHQNQNKYPNADKVIIENFDIDINLSIIISSLQRITEMMIKLVLMH